MEVMDRVHWARQRAWLGLVIALFTAGAAISIRVLLGEALEGFPFITFFPAILISALFGGIWAGVICTVVSALFADYFLLEPHGWGLSWPSGWIGMASFLAVAAVMIVLMEVAFRARERVAATADLLRQLNEQLEHRVHERTAALQAEGKARLAAEGQMQQMQKMEAVGQLTGGIAHDFNNMLTIIIGNLDIARRRLGAGNTDVERLFDNALDGAKRAASLTHQLLAFSRQQPLAPVVTDVNGLVSGMAELLRRALGELVDLECVLAGGLWHTEVDPGQLENALLNLAVNARDAMPAGGRLTLETQNAYLDDQYAAGHLEVLPGQYVLIAVSDTGTGMTPDVMAKAFEPFFTTKPEGRGTGLGLSQVFGFIKQSKGHIKIYSELGGGTTMKIYLPRAAAAEASASTIGSSAAVASTPHGSPDEIVLVVDDDAAVLRVTVDTLRELNYSVKHATTGEAALALVNGVPGIRLLFTDVVMPGMNGRELADRVLAINPALPVIYTTGYTRNAVVHNGIIDRDVELLQKPFAYDQLARKVRQMLDSPTRIGVLPHPTSPGLPKGST